MKNLGVRILTIGVLLVGTSCGGKNTPQPQPPPNIANPASVYCQLQGGRTEIVETPKGQQGICVLPSGIRCDEWAYYRGECPAAQQLRQ